MDKEGHFIKVNEDEGAVEVKVDPEIYPLSIIYQACDVFLDRAHVFIKGDPESEVKVVLKPKDKDMDLRDLGGEFSNELVNYSSYFIRKYINKDMRNTILKRAFLTGNDKDKEEAEKKVERLEKSQEKIDLGEKVPIVEDEKENSES